MKIICQKAGTARFQAKSLVQKWLLFVSFFLMQEIIGLSRQQILLNQTFNSSSQRKEKSENLLDILIDKFSATWHYICTSERQNNIMLLSVMPLLPQIFETSIIIATIDYQKVANSEIKTEEFLKSEVLPLWKMNVLSKESGLKELWNNTQVCHLHIKGFKHIYFFH